MEFVERLKLLDKDQYKRRHFKPLEFMGILLGKAPYLVQSQNLLGVNCSPRHKVMITHCGGGLASFPKSAAWQLTVLATRG